MPKLDGVQVLELLRRGCPRDTWIPVVVITGEASAANRRRALAAGATDVLAKPLDASEATCASVACWSGAFCKWRSRSITDHLRVVAERTEQLQRALDDLQSAQRQMLKQERLSAFAEMAGGVVHDFSNALMSVIGYSDMLITADGRNLDDRNTALEYLHIINTAARDAGEIVSRLRDFYRPRNNAESQLVDLQDVLHQAVLMTQPKWNDAGRPAGTEIGGSGAAELAYSPR